MNALPRPSDLMARDMLRTDAPDFGDDLGQAARARPSIKDRVGGEWRGSTRTGEVDARRYLDECLYDRLLAVAQISDRQHRAAEKLAGWWTAAGLNPKTTARYGERQDAGDVLEADSTGDEDLPPRDRYRRLMRRVSPLYADILEKMLCSQHPGVNRLATLQVALSHLADVWKIERDGDAG